MVVSQQKADHFLALCYHYMYVRYDCEYIELLYYFGKRKQNCILNHMQPVCQYIVTQGRTTTYDTYDTYVARLNTYQAPLLTQNAF